jgi:anion-transporting  ArsA/GET3 family ATPase
LAGKALDRFGVIDFATSIAPGLRDVLLTGKVYEAVRRRIKNRPNSYDAVVVDAPPTGRIAQFLNVHEAVSGLAKVGPIRNQADSIMEMLHSAQTVVHLVTLLEDMPVTETEEAVAALVPTRITVRSVIANMVTPNPLDEEVLHAAAAGRLELSVPGLSPADNEILAAEFAVEAARRLQESQRRDILCELGLPLVDVRFDAGGIDDGALFAIAQQLGNQLPAEVA